MQIIEPVVSLQCGELNLDVATRFREQGDDLLILLHGLGCSKESFEGAFDAPELRGYAICALDFPGHGGSSRNLPSSCYSLEACADITGQLIRRMMTKLGYNRVYVAGHSMGGAVAVLVPDGEYGITSLVSIDGNLIAEDCGLVSRGIAEQSVEQFVSQGYHDFNSALYGSAQPDDQAWAQWSSNAAPEAMHAAGRCGGRAAGRVPQVAPFPLAVPALGQVEGEVAPSVAGGAGGDRDQVTADGRGRGPSRTARLARAPAARSRLCAIAAIDSQAAFARKRPMAGARAARS